jgi:hypothetical protein
MHWFWEDAEKKERGYCSAAVSRTQHMMWATEWEGHDRHDLEKLSLPGSEQLGRREQASWARRLFDYMARRQYNAFEVVVEIVVVSAIVLAVMAWLL